MTNYNFTTKSNMKICQLLFALAFLLISTNDIMSHTNKNTETSSNPLICDPATGMCELPTQKDDKQLNIAKTNSSNKLKVVYFTDPICSSCWGIEPQLRRMKLEYGDQLDIEYRMGGLLPDWNYNNGGISKPSDVAHHWDEVSQYYDMPIDGDVWLEDPLDSSYPPSIAYRAAMLQNPEKANLFMREIREMVFLKKINIAKWENLAIAAKTVGLDTDQLEMDYNGKAKDLFQEDLKLAREYGVRGFPTVFISNQAGKQETVYGSKPYQAYEAAISSLLPESKKTKYDSDLKFLFSKFGSLTAREFAELAGVPRSESETLLDKEVASGFLKKLATKNGSIWMLK